MTDNIFDIIETGDAVRSEAALGRSWKLNPEQEARKQAIAKRLGVTPTVVSTQFDTLDAYDKGRQASAALSSAPKARGWMADPENAAIAHDQVQPIAGMEANFGTITKGLFASGRAGGEKAVLGGMMAIGDYFRPLLDRLSWTDVYGTRHSLADGGNREEQRKFAQADFRRDLTQPAIKGTAGRWTYGAADSLLQMIPGAAMSVALRNPTPTLAGMGLSSGLQQYGTVETRGGSATEAAISGAAVGGIEVATEKLGLGFLAERFGKVGFKAFIGGLLAREIPGELVATHAQDAVDTAIANPNATWNDYWASRLDATGQTIAATVLMGGAFGAAHHAAGRLGGLARDRVAAQEAPIQAENFNTLVEAVKASPLPERSPERFADLMNKLSGDTEVSLPADAVREYMQSLATPADQKAFLDATQIGDQLDTAIGEGAEVTMPAGAYLAHIAPTDAHATFANVMRIGDGMSVEEAKAFQATYSELVQSSAHGLGDALAKGEEAAAPGRRVLEEVQSQALKAGYTADAARAYGTLYASRYEARAERVNLGRDQTGEAPTDAWSQFELAGAGTGVKIRSALPGQLSARVDKLDLVADALRKGKRADTNQGPSLLDFVSRTGGIVDLGGELAAMDAGSWHKGKPGKRKLVRAASQDTEANLNASLERVAERAVDAGYLPEGAGEAELLAAMQAELRGAPVHAAAPDQRSADFNAAVDQLDELLGRLGVSPDTATNAQIKDAVSAYAAQEAGRSFDQTERGKITFTGGRAVIQLFQGKDLSTLLHESGHLWLEELAFDAAAPDATDQLKTDLETTRAWMGLKDGQEIGVEQHEQWARGVEAYLMEGKAPSAALRDVFARFRVWLTRIYKSLTGLNVKVSPEMRNVFGRLLATDQEIGAAHEAQALNRLFDSPKAAGMTAAEYARYTAEDQAATQAGTERLLRKTMEPIRRAKTKAWKAEREAMREEMEAKIDAAPDLRAIAIIHSTNSPMSRDVLVDMLHTEAGLDRLPRRVPALYSDKGTLHPDDLAQQVGVSSGEALVNLLMAQAEEQRAMREGGDKRSVRAARVEAAIEAEMIARHGDVLRDGTIEKEAMIAVHEIQRAEQLAAEGKALAKMAGQDGAGWSRAALELFAKERIGGMKAAKLRPASYLRAERASGIAAQRALIKEDFAGALEAKFAQTVNFHLYRAAIDAQQAVGKGLALFEKVNGGKDEVIAKRRNLDIVNTARAILARYGYDAPKKSPAEYLALVQEYDPGAYDALKPYVEAADSAAKPIDDLTSDEFDDLAGVVDQLWRMSRADTVTDAEGRKVELEAVVSELADNLLASHGPAPERAGGSRGVTRGEKNGYGWLGWLASMKKVEEWATRQGPAFTKYVWSPVKAAADGYRADRETYLPKLKAALDTIAPDFKKPVKIDAPEIGYTFGAEGNAGLAELIGALRHIGNDSNKEKLLLGRGWATLREDGSMDTSRWDAFLARKIADGTLAKRHFDYLQSEWDLHEEVKPLAQKAHRALYGRYFDEVTANPFETPFGTYAGGYVAAKADPYLDERAAVLSDQDLLRGGGGSFMFPGPANGFTKSRVNSNRPLDLNLALAISQIDQVLKFAHMGPAVRDVNRILTNKKFGKLLGAYDATAWSDMLLPWLKTSATQQINTPTAGHGGRFADRAVRAISRNVGMTIMFGSLINTAQQITGLPVAALRTGKRNMASALVNYLANPAEATRTVLEASPMMRERNRSQTIALTVAANEIVLNPNPLQKFGTWTQQHAYWMQHGFQNMLDPIVWLAARTRAVELGEENPTWFADAVIGASQGSNNPEDLARFSTGSTLLAPFKMFSGYFIGQANMLATEFGGAKDIGRKAEIVALGVLVPAIVGQLIADALRGGWDDDEGDGYWDEFLGSAVLATTRYALAMVPFGGAAVNTAISQFDDKPYNDKTSISPAASVVDTAARVPIDLFKIAKGEGDASNTVRDVLTAVSLLAGVPTAPRQAAYVADVLEGDITPTGPVDAGRGFVTGTASQASRQ